MMRLSIYSVVFSLVLSGSAMAQEQAAPRLYVGSGSGSSTLYNSNQNGNGAGKPLSLKQILKGKNETGYEYSREGTGFTPYGTKSMYSSGSISPSAEEVTAYRAQQAREARKREEDAQRSLLAYNAPDPAQQQINQQTQGYLNQFQTPAAQPYYGGTYVAPRPVYQGRDLGVNEPKKVFNSVQ